MVDLSEITGLNKIYFEFLRLYFSKIPVHYGLSLKKHPENNEESIFFSYRGVVHTFNFRCPVENIFFNFKTRTNQGISAEFREKHLLALSNLNPERREIYNLSFGDTSFLEKPIILSEGIGGIETIAITPFHRPELITSLERDVFPFIFPVFLQPSNEIAFRRIKST